MLTNLTGHCSPCHETCLRCTGSTEFDCTECKNGWILRNNSFCVRQVASSDQKNSDDLPREGQSTKLMTLALSLGGFSMLSLAIFLIIVMIQRNEKYREKYADYDSDLGNPLLGNGVLENNDLSYYEDTIKSASPEGTSL
ncbi:unnamed protein product [Dimorphilus gyrociliatus]|uniref:Uncharacterized protein n=1 Tax=Dimorphilus gyrociliatus TaxID=2664684 RepID=A0A7I8VK46_9ANNE|nr:unnamed protein product [Dimorphilus gyrociliatus]